MEEQEEAGWCIGPVHRKWTWLPGQGSTERMKGQEARIRAPGAGSHREAVAGGMFWFCFQKYSSGLAATFKDLKIWKQALGKRSTENSSSEYGKC